MNRKFSFSAVKGPEALARELFGRTPGYIRTTFCAAVVLGLATHLYMLTNKFINHDEAMSIFGTDYGTGSGRWLLPQLMHLDGEFSVPWLIGLLSILFLAGAACFSVSLLRIRRPVGCAVTAALMVSFPTVTSTFTYMFSADVYLFSLLLAAFGAWAAVKWGLRGSAAGAAAIALSLSIYQAYFPTAAALMVGALLLETLDGERSFRELFLRGVQLLGTLIAALALYMLSVRITTGGEQLVDYMGLRNMGKLSLGELPQLVADAYHKYFLFFWQDEKDVHFPLVKYALLLAALATAALLVLLLRRRRLGAARTALAAALFVIFPLAADLIFIMVPDAEIHDLMIYGLCYVLVLPIALAEYGHTAVQGDRDKLFRAAVSWVVMAAMALTAYSYIVTDNRVYFRLDMSMRQAEAYSNRLLGQIEGCEGYRPGMDVVLVGSDKSDASLFPAPMMGRSRLTGAVNMAGLRTCYTYGFFLRIFLGYSGPVALGDSAQGKAAANMQEVKAMPSYPAQGSIQVIQDTLYVKLN